MIVGIIPAAGNGSRLQPLGFSKELLPLPDGDKPKPVIQFVMDRMALAGCHKFVVVVSPKKPELVRYFAGKPHIQFAIQSQPRGLCDAIFRAFEHVRHQDTVLIGLPDTIWYPESAYVTNPEDVSLICFPSEDVSVLDAVEEDGHVRVKEPPVRSGWAWGAVSMTGQAYHQLRGLWLTRKDEYLGTLLNAYSGKIAVFRTGTEYLDTGTLEGWMKAIDTVRA